MRNYIKTLAMLLMVSLGFVACNDSDDFDEYKVNYPTTMPLGYYHSNHTFDSDYEYGVLLTKNAANDTVIQILMEGKADGADSASVRTILVSSDMVYNDTIGLLVTNSVAEDNFFEKDTKAFLAYKKDRNQMILSLEYGGNKVNTVLAPTAVAPAVASRWVANGLIFDIKNVGENADMLPGTINLNPEDESAAEDLTYSYANGEGNFTTNSGKKGTFKYVDNYLLEVVFEGKTYTCERTFSTPEPESFETIAVGVMNHGVQNLAADGGILFDFKYEAEIGVSDKKPHRYCLRPWLNNPEGMIFEIDPATGFITVPQQFTGFDSSQIGLDYGPIFGVDTFTFLGQINSVVQENNIMFAMAYVVKAGALSFAVDLFEITEGTAPTSAITPLAPATDSFISTKTLLSK